MTLDRRQFLSRSSAAVLAGALAAPGVAAGATPKTGQASGHGSGDPLQADGPPQFATVPDPAARMPAVPFHGEHQAGITDAPPPAACFAAFDVTADDRAGLIALLRTLTSRCRFLTHGGPPTNLGPVAPPSDSGTLGPVVPADGLTVTVGLGSSLFDDRYGIATRKPVHLTPMVSFPNDNLDPAQTGGDMLLQICAGSADAAIHALRDIAKHTRGAMQVRWRLDGFASPARPAGVPRNHFGFEDGIANPNVADPEVARRLLWVTAGVGEPDWAIGGSYHVCRIIRMFIEFWDRVSLNEQQTMIGRYRATGAPLGDNKLTDIPDYRADPLGHVIPLSAHMRLANPRTKKTQDSRILRRGYNYDNGIDLAGDLDMGLIFNCFQRNIKRQFEATQIRLIGEPMVDYISPVGGGYFFALPGVRDERDWFARRLFQT
ncbi:MAG TPA: Dyp-type peroxidase [Solirubrobacteraceae bacterium]|nr:Dyp-type peroxidase [Solirubrobacteraceae bacterium]